MIPIHYDPLWVCDSDALKSLVIPIHQVSGGDEGRTSMSTESTFNSVNVNEGPRLTPQILDILTELCETLAQRLSAEDLSVRTYTTGLSMETFM